MTKDDAREETSRGGGAGENWKYFEEKKQELTYGGKIFASDEKNSNRISQPEELCEKCQVIRPRTGREKINITVPKQKKDGR